MHLDLRDAVKIAYEPSGLQCSQLKREAESQDYAASQFEMNQKQVRFRVAKITPTKIGQFVTLWKRIGQGPIQPFDESDPIDLVVVSVRSGENFGQFVFPKKILVERDIFSKEGKGGKRAMRVYPPWDHPDSRQAKATQSWQLPYFFEIAPKIDIERVRSLFLK